MLDLAAEEADAAYLEDELGEEGEPEIPLGGIGAWRAWHALRFDRPYFAFGGEGRIGFAALDAYARRYDVEGEAFDDLSQLVGALDDEWLDWVKENMPKGDQSPP